MFDKHGQTALREFSETMYREYGVRVAILAGYCDSQGEPTITLYVSNSMLLLSNASL